MTKRQGLVLVVCGLVLLAGTFAFGESKETDFLRFSVQVRVDSTDNRDSVPVNEESNIDIYLRPMMEAGFDWDQTMLDFFYAPAYRYRTDPSRIQNDSEFQHDLGAHLRHSLTRRMTVRVVESFTFTDDPKVSEGGTTLRRDESYLLNNVEAGLTYGFTRRSNIDVYGRHNTKQYSEADVADISDEDSFVVGATGRRQFGRTVDGLCTVSFSDYGYQHPFMIERDFTSLYVGVGVEKIFNPQLRGGIKGGMQMIDYDDAGLGSEESPYAQAWVKTSSKPATRYEASVTHGIRDADAYPFAAQKYTDVRGRVEHDVSTKVTLAGSGTYRVGDYDDTAPTSAGTGTFFSRAGGDETTIVAQGEVAYRLGKESVLRLTQQYQDVDSDVDTSFDRNTTSLSLTKQF